MKSLSAIVQQQLRLAVEAIVEDFPCANFAIIPCDETLPPFALAILNTSSCVAASATRLDSLPGEGDLEPEQPTIESSPRTLN